MERFSTEIPNPFGTFILAVQLRLEFKRIMAGKQPHIADGNTVRQFQFGITKRFEIKLIEKIFTVAGENKKFFSRRTKTPARV